MVKRLISIILTLSITASLFAGLTFSASAAEYDVVGGNDKKAYLNEDGTLLAETSLIKNAGPLAVYAYNNTDNKYETATKVAADSALKYATAFPVSNDKGVAVGTTDNNFAKWGAADMYVFSDPSLRQGMFVTYNAENKVETIIDDEDQQWAQVNYALPKNAQVTSISIATLKGETNNWKVKHYKVILSDTQEGLLDESKAKKVYEVEDNTYNVSKINLTEAVSAKFIAYRLICPYADGLKTANFAKSSLYIRASHFDVQGSADGTLTATNPTNINVVPPTFGGDKSLIKDKVPDADLSKYYNATERTTTYEGKTYTLAATETPAKAVLAAESALKNFTSATNTSNDAKIVPDGISVDAKYQFNLFNINNGTKITDIIDNEEEQWFQLVYKLDALSEIDRFFLGANKSTTLYQEMPSHYKVILSETEEGLYDTDKASKVIEIDMKTDESARANLHNFVLTEPVKAKYVGLRFICARNNIAKLTRQLSAGAYWRITHFGVFGEYANPITATAAEATAKGAPTTPTATFNYVGNTDNSGKYGAATVALATEATIVDAEKKEYNFVGWYLGDEPISNAASYTYNVKSTDAATLNFVAKYEVEMYKMTGVNNKNNATPEKGFNVEPENSLLADAKVESVYYLNTDLNDAEELRAMQPTKLADNMLSSQIGSFTSVAKTTTDVMIFNIGSTTASSPAKALAEAMFVQHDGTTVTALDKPEESKQWVQVNYKLPAEASVEDLILSYNKNANDNISRWTPSSYVYILADSEEDLLNGNGTRIKVNHNADTIKNITKVALTEPTTAKYIGVRFLQLYNDFNPAGGASIMSDNFKLTNGLYARFNHLDVHGTYTTNVDDVTVTVEKDNEVDGIVVSKADAVYGVADSNGKHATGTVTVTASATGEDANYTYEFDGWYNGEKRVSEEAVYTYDLVGGNVTLTAKYTATKKTVNYTVTFKDWDGTELKTETVEEGNAATAPADPAREGYTFTGWDVAFNNVTDNLTVNAVYEINKYTVTYQAEGHDDIVITVNHGDKVAEIPAVPAKDGFTAAWSEDLSTTPITGNKTVTAKYDVIMLTVTFVANGENVKVETVAWGAGATAPEDPEKEGHTFTGWDKAFTNVKENITVTAQFKINTYTVTFKDWDGTELKSETVEHGKAATAPADPAREGYTFTDWDVAFNNVTDNLTVTATYTINKYTVTFVDYDGTVISTETVEYGAKATAPADPTRVGYTFAGWDVAFNNVTDNLTVTATYTINKYTVTFVDYDGTVISTETVEYGAKATAPADPAREGYTFAGWDVAFNNVTDNLTVTATYTINKYTVTFVDYDGTVISTETVEHGKAATAPADPTKEGYTFTGWDKDGTNITEDTTITAQFKINTYTVTFMADGKLVEEVQVDYGKAATAPAVPQKYGYNGLWENRELTNVTESFVVNAVYTEKEGNCTIKFESVTGKLLGEVIVEEGNVPSKVLEVLAQIKEINKKVEAVYGYTVKLNDNGDVFWSNEVYDEAITTEVSVRPEYVADESVTTNVYVEDVEGDVLINEEARYDSAVTLVSKQNATYWTDAKENGAVVLGAESGTLYACGSDMKIYAQIGTFDKKEVTIVGKTHKEGEGFSVFAHVNVEGATKYGFIFASSKYYNEKEENKDFKIEDLTPKRVTNVEVETANVEGKVDFMTTLHYSDSLPNPTRYARAYVVVNNGDGEQYIYSDVICNK